MASLPRIGSDIRTPLMDSYSQEGQEDSQKKITDNKISALIEECGICFVSKNAEELQTIPHEKYTEDQDDSTTKCQAHIKPLYCKDCIIQLVIPKRCPLCRDGLATPSSIAIQIQPDPIEEDEQVDIPIPDIAEEHDEDGEEFPVQWSRTHYIQCGLESCKFICFFGCVAGIAIAIHIVSPYLGPGARHF